MRFFVVVSVVACGGAGYGAERCPLMADGRQQFRNEQGQCQDQPTRGVGGVGTVPPAQRNHRMIEKAGIERVTVQATPAGAASWTLTVANEGDAAISVLYDESSFVTSTGNSWGRLIRGETRKINAAQTQPPIPIAPHARATGFVVPEGAIHYEEFESWVVGRYESRGVGNVLERVDKERAELKTAIDGGHLYLVVEGANGKKTWTGVVEAKADR